MWIVGKKRTVRPKKRWGDVIKSHMRNMGLGYISEENTGNRVKWKCKDYGGRPQIVGRDGEGEEVQY